jgi:hypothetical protein
MTEESVVNAGERREHYIPIRRADLVDLLCRQPALTAGERDEFRQLCRIVEASFHFEFHRRLEALKNAYAPFDPDADTRPLTELRPEEKQERLEKLFHRFIVLLERANFKRLSRDEIAKALEDASHWGLNFHVDFALYDKLEVFARGDGIQRRSLRRLRNLLRKEDIDVPIYQRLVVILRLHPDKRLGKLVDTEGVYIKLYKDIPKMDLEMLLPGTQVRMGLWDRFKISSSLMTGLGVTGWKLTTGTVMALLVNKLALLSLAGGTIGYGLRSFYGYLSTKQKYQLTLTESLFFQNLDNNAGALFRLLDEAEEQECREAVLAYFCLWRSAGEEGWTTRELDQHVEQLLEQACGVRVDFEIHDALHKLERLGIVEELPGGRQRAVPITKALVALDRAWDAQFKYADVGGDLAGVS